MTSASSTPQSSQPGRADQLAAVRQIDELIAAVLVHLVGETSLDDARLARNRSDAGPDTGILAVRGVLEEGVVHLAFELLRSEERFLTDTQVLNRLALLKDHRAFLIPPEEIEDGTPASCWAGLTVKARPLDYERGQRLTGAVKYLQDLAVSLQRELPQPAGEDELTTAFAEIAEVRPIAPWEAILPGAAPLREWAAEVRNYLGCGLSVAAVVQSHLQAEMAQAALSRVILGDGRKLARLAAALPMKALPELLHKLPDEATLVAPAAHLSLGTNRYDQGTDARVTLAEIQAEGLGVLFSGRYDELQRAMSGGPGAVADPRHPLIRRVPPVGPEVAARFTLQSELRRRRLPARLESEALGELLEAIRGLPAEQQLQILPAATRKVLQRALPKVGNHGESVRSFVRHLEGSRETFTGLGAVTRFLRRPHVQRTYQHLADPALRTLLESHLVAQPRAIRAVCERLRAEALGRPLDQPLRLLMLATPGVGKSRSCQLIAEHLGTRYEQINLGGQTSEHSAMAQVIGAAPGYVGSDRPGVFEKVARTAEEEGLLLEVADLDHASPQVRNALTGLFLGPLDQGSLQNAAGDRIPCSSLLIVFTMNLPGNADERLGRGMGFIGASCADVLQTAVRELRDATSNAFLSRLGTPVYFEQLGESALGAIFEQNIQETIRLAAARLGLRIGRVTISPGTGAALIAHEAPVGIATLGARGIQELARGLATRALLELPFPDATPGPDLFDLQIAADANGKLSLRLTPTTSHDA